MFSLAVQDIRQEHVRGHYGLPLLGKPSAASGRKATWDELLTMS
jgi:hypothetical protein